MAADEPARNLRYYEAILVADEQMHPVTSNGKALARFTLDLDTMLMRYRVTYEGLTSGVKSIGIYGPAQMGTGGVLTNDLSQGSTRSPVEGITKVDPATLQYFIVGWAYTNIHTDKYPDGEVRGQLDPRASPDISQYPACLRRVVRHRLSVAASDGGRRLHVPSP
jgi:hypothetical protein